MSWAVYAGLVKKEDVLDQLQASKDQQNLDSGSDEQVLAALSAVEAILPSVGSEHVIVSLNGHAPTDDPGSYPHAEVSLSISGGTPSIEATEPDMTVIPHPEEVG